MRVNPLSICSYFTELYYNDTRLSSATSFSYVKSEKKYLVTNYHVAYGRNPITNKPIMVNAALPNRLVIYYISKEGRQLTYYIKFDEFENPFKYIKKKNRTVDIAVCPLKDFNGVAINEVCCLFPEIEYRENITLEITEELFVLGYPKGISALYTPIWKKASVASEPEVPIDEMACFYIDSSTRDGMSGAPVIFYNKNGQCKTTDVLFQISNSKIFKFEGIYSGRDSNQELGITQLGVVWKKELIDEIIDMNTM